jgi:hypothetical protein
VLGSGPPSAQVGPRCHPTAMQGRQYCVEIIDSCRAERRFCVLGGLFAQSSGCPFSGPVSQCFAVREAKAGDGTWHGGDQCE